MKVVQPLPAKLPKEQKTGPDMDYNDPSIMFPKPKKKPKKKGWGKK
jgi:hypothetical protein